MHTLTPSLSLIILIATMAPSSLAYSLGSVFRRGKAPSSADNGSLLLLLATLSATILSVLILLPGMALLRPMPVTFVAVTVLCAALCLVIETSLGALFLYLATGRWTAGISLHGYWDGFPMRLLWPTLLVSAGEELIYRLFWFQILQSQFGLPVAATVFLSALCYGLNHLFFGYANVISKTACGVLYGALYVLSGYSVLAPILTHILHNLFLLLMARGLRHA